MIFSNAQYTSFKTTYPAIPLPNNLNEILNSGAHIDNKLIENDRLGDINNWLRVNVHQYGLMKSPTEIIKDSCNSCIDTKPIIKYYTDKYSKIYNL